MNSEPMSFTKIHHHEDAKTHPSPLDLERTRNPKMLLIRAVNSIIGQPTMYDQREWHRASGTSCGSVHCFLGWIECHYLGRLINGDETPRQFQYLDKEVRENIAHGRASYHADYVHAELCPSYTELCSTLIYGRGGYAKAVESGFLDLSHSETTFAEIYGWVCDFVGHSWSGVHRGNDSKDPSQYELIPESCAD